MQSIQKNELFISADLCEKFIVSKESCIAHHDAEMCFLLNCRFQISLMSNVEDLLQKLDPLCFTFQHVTVSIQCSSIILVEILWSRVVKCLIICKEQSVLIEETEDWTECPAREKRFLRKKCRKPLLSFFQKTKSTRTRRSVFAERIERVKVTTHGLELVKIGYCFPDGYRSYSNNWVTFETKSLCACHFTKQRALKW